MILPLERDFCSGELEHKGGSWVGTYCGSWPRICVGGRRAPPFYFFTLGEHSKYFQVHQPTTVRKLLGKTKPNRKCSWYIIKQRPELVSLPEVKIATSFLTSWKLDGNQPPRRRDKQKMCNEFTRFDILLFDFKVSAASELTSSIRHPQSTITLWWQVHFLSNTQTAQMDKIEFSDSAQQSTVILQYDHENYNVLL